MVHARWQSQQWESQRMDRPSAHTRQISRFGRSAAACAPPSVAFKTQLAKAPKVAYDPEHPLLPYHDYTFHVTGNFHESVLLDHMKRWRLEDGTPRTDAATLPALEASLKKVVKQLQPRLAHVPLTHDFVVDEIAHCGGLFKVYLWREVLYKTEAARQFTESFLKQIKQTSPQAQPQPQPATLQL